MVDGLEERCPCGSSCLYNRHMSEEASGSAQDHGAATQLFF
jgi:hypothetical protein